MQADETPTINSTDITGKRWHVAVVKPQVQYREIAKRALTARGYSALMPMCRELVGGKAVEHPMYGRYLFVGVPPTMDSWNVRWTPGIQHLTLDARRRPVVIGESVLEAIVARMMQDGGTVDLLPKPTVVGSGFSAGQPVRVTDGLLIGCEGLFQGDQGDRCRVLLRVAGPESAIVLPASSLVAA